MQQSPMGTLYKALVDGIIAGPVSSLLLLVLFFISIIFSIVALRLASSASLPLLLTCCSNLFLNEKLSRRSS
jgi:hypothetical protein